MMGVCEARRSREMPVWGVAFAETIQEISIAVMTDGRFSAGRKPSQR
jgi:hypothetical protein